MPDFNTVIFNKNGPQTGGLSHDEVWDDSLLIRHYDEIKAKLDKKRGRQEDNSVNQSQTEMSEDQEGFENLSCASSEPRTSQGNKRSKRKKGKKKDWKEGDFCRFRYSEDGNLYEAEITSINHNTGTCNIKYVGYGNEETVTISKLMRTLGESFRLRQIDEAERLGYNSKDQSMLDDEYSTAPSEAMSEADNRSERSFNFNRQQMRAPHRMPHLPDLPPPPALGFDMNDPRSEALHTMLMSWYMTGYHTGYYQGLSQNKK